MRRFIALTTVLSLALSASAQSTGTTGSQPERPDFEGSQPSSNLDTARSHGPGTWVTAARARHTALNGNRLSYQRGTATDSNSTAAGTTNTGGSSTSTGGLGDAISGLLGGALGGSVDLGAISGLLGGLTGSSNSTNTNTGTNTGTGTSTNPNIPSNLTPEAIALLQQFGFNVNDLFPASSGKTRVGASATLDATNESGLMLDRTWKADPRSQTATSQPTESFGERWRNAMIATINTNIGAAFLGLNTVIARDLRANIEDVIRDILDGDLFQTN